MSTYSSLIRSPIRTLVMVAAMATAASFALPQEVQAQHFGHGFGHRSSFGHSFHGSSFGHGFGGSRFYGPAYRPNRGSVRISKEFREDAQVYLDGAHVGVVDDFDGIFQSLRLVPGTYELEIELNGDQSFRQQIFVSRGRTYKVRYGIDASDAVGLTSGTEASSRGRTSYVRDRFNSGGIRIQVKPAKDEAQVYVDGARAGVVDDFDGVFQRLNLPTEDTTWRSDLLDMRPSGSWCSSAPVEPTRSATSWSPIPGRWRPRSLSLTSREQRRWPLSQLPPEPRRRVANVVGRTRPTAHATGGVTVGRL